MNKQHIAFLKTLISFAIIMVTALMPQNFFVGYLVTACVLLIFFLLSSITLIKLFKRIIITLPFILGISLLALFRDNGVIIFLSLITKSSLCITTIILLTESTSFSDLLFVFKKLKIPALLITTIMLTYRYLFVLIEERNRLNIARQSRTYKQTKTQSWKNLSTVIALLFIRTSERADRVYHAMCARGLEI